jgi:hypothetical protein
MVEMVVLDLLFPRPSYCIESNLPRQVASLIFAMKAAGVSMVIRSVIQCNGPHLTHLRLCLDYVIRDIT